MHYDNNIDDLCWYEVGGRRHYNKLEALFDHINSQQPLRFNVNDEEYSKHNWSVEPTPSLEELYARRAIQIRNKYDYLVLHFSGGSDSCNILETFIRNKIFIDEIIVRGSYRFCSGKAGVVTMDDMYSEIFNQSVPLAEWAKEHHFPHMKITVVETSEIVNDFFKNATDWLEQGLCWLTPGSILKSRQDILAPHWQHLSDSGKKIAHINGAEKPKIYQEKNYFYTRWLDSEIAGWNTVKHGKDQLPQYIECFYRGRHTIELQIKQLHVLKNFIKTQVVRSSDWHPSSGRAYENFVAALVYKRTLPLTCLHLKDTSDSPIDLKDSWFAKDKFSQSYNNWQKGVEFLQSSLPPQYLDNKKNVTGIWSRPYFLGT